jgi:ABC-type microcin C transport system permease subunit YejE
MFLPVLSKFSVLRALGMTFACPVLTAEAGTFLQCHFSISFTTALLSTTSNPRMPKHMISAGTDGAGDDMMARAVMVKMLSINNLILTFASYVQLPIETILFFFKFLL